MPGRRSRNTCRKTALDSTECFRRLDFHTEAPVHTGLAGGSGVAAKAVGKAVGLAEGTAVARAEAERLAAVARSTFRPRMC
jgi:hypothetical protein